MDSSILKFDTDLETLVKLASQFNDPYEFDNYLNRNKFGHNREHSFLRERFTRLNRGTRLHGNDKIEIYRTGDSSIKWGDYVYLNYNDALHAYQAGQGNKIYKKVVPESDIIQTSIEDEYYYSPKKIAKIGEDLIDFWNFVNKSNTIKQLEHISKQLDKVLKETPSKKFNLNIKDYEHGRCDVFVLALHQVLGYDMYFFIDNDADFNNDDGDEENVQYGKALVHAYCKDKNGNMYDASGLIDLDDVENTHADYVNEPEHELVSDTLFKKYIAHKFIAKIDNKELDSVKDYINQNVNKYQSIQLNEDLNPDSRDPDEIFQFIKSFPKKYKIEKFAGIKLFDNGLQTAINNSAITKFYSRYFWKHTKRYPGTIPFPFDKLNDNEARFNKLNELAKIYEGHENIYFQLVNTVAVRAMDFILYEMYFGIKSRPYDIKKEVDNLILPDKNDENALKKFEKQFLHRDGNFALISLYSHANGNMLSTLEQYSPY